MLAFLLAHYAHQKYAALWSLGVSGAPRLAQFDQALQRQAAAATTVPDPAPVRAPLRWVL